MQNATTRALSAAAAIASRRPRVEIEAPCEQGAIDAIAHVEARCGPSPQAELIEPSTPGDPWLARVVLPHLPAADEPALTEALRRCGEVLWRVAPSDALAEAEDLGLCLLDDTWATPVCATLRATLAGEPTTPDLALGGGVDAAILALDLDLSRALQAADAALRWVSDRGPDTVQPVVHRSSGRVGLLACLHTADPIAALPAAAQAIAEVIEARATHPVALAPDVRWWPSPVGLHLVAWLICAPVESLPSDPPAPAQGLSPDPRALAALLADEGFCDALEIQVFAGEEEALEALVARDIDDWGGGPSRWVRTDAGWRFAPTWLAPRSFHTIERLAGLGLPARVVPAEPRGLPDAAWLERHVRWGPQRVAVRYRDPVEDHDRQPQAAPRPEVRPDAAWAAAARSAWPEAQISPVLGADGRPGLRLEGPLAGAEAAITALTGLDHPGTAAWIDVSFPRSGGCRAWLWARVPPTAERAWGRA